MHPALKQQLETFKELNPITHGNKKELFPVPLVVPLARLELAPRLSPDWILSPTRLPIPPQGLKFFFK